MNTTAKTESKSNPNNPARDLDPAGGKAKAKPKAAGAGVSHAKRAALPPPQVISEIHLIPLERIEVVAQVRTEFDEGTIAELAADIEERGMRQAVEVTPIGDEKYRLTMGERRLRAIKKLGLNAIPAVIVKTDERSRLADQLAENIQREDLSLKDQANAVRDLFEELGSLDAVARMVKKSKAWVSKRLSITLEGFSTAAIHLLEVHGIEDMEILGTVNQVEKKHGWRAADEFASMVFAKKMNRQDCRDWLKKFTDQKEAERVAAQVEREKATQKPKVAPPPPVFNALNALAKIEQACCQEFDDEKPDVNKILLPYNLDQLIAMQGRLFEAYERGLQSRGSGNAIKSIIQFTANRFGEVLEHTAFLHGYFDSPFELSNIVENAIHMEE